MVQRKRRAAACRGALLLLLAVILGACARAPSTPGAPAPGPWDATAGGDRERLLAVARRQLGTPYRYGGSAPGGFDCSGLVQFAHRQVGIAVPRTARAQWRRARVPNRRHLLPGDLLFFEIGPRKRRHVAIYEGHGRFIHAPSSGKTVSRASLDNPFWRTRLLGKRTFL